MAQSLLKFSPNLMPIEFPISAEIELSEQPINWSSFMFNNGRVIGLKFRSIRSKICISLAWLRDKNSRKWPWWACNLNRWRLAQYNGGRGRHHHQSRWWKVNLNPTPPLSPPNQLIDWSRKWQSQLQFDKVQVSPTQKIMMTPGEEKEFEISCPK